MRARSAPLQVARIRERQRGKVRCVDLDQRQICHSIQPNQLAIQRSTHPGSRCQASLAPTIVQQHANLARIQNHVCVRHDVPIGRKNYARARSVLRGKNHCRVRTSAVAQAVPTREHLHHGTADALRQFRIESLKQCKGSARREGSAGLAVPVCAIQIVGKSNVRKKINLPKGI